MEVVMKEGGGGDHVSVGVRKPRSKSIRPVSKRDIFVRPPSKRIRCILTGGKSYGHHA